jgi:hypothetical protein
VIGFDSVRESPFAPAEVFVWMLGLKLEILIRAPTGTQEHGDDGDDAGKAHQRRADESAMTRTDCVAVVHLETIAR